MGANFEQKSLALSHREGFRLLSTLPFRGSSIIAKPPLNVKQILYQKNTRYHVCCERFGACFMSDYFELDGFLPFERTG